MSTFSTVARPEKVRVHAQDRKGKHIEIEGEGLLARCLCHELDHLDGVLYIDEMDREMTPEEIEADNRRQERLAQKVKEAAEEAKQKRAEATARFFRQLRQDAQKIAATW